MGTPSRNDPCPCGSGKKYKQCCLKRDEALASSKRTETASVPRMLQEAIEHHQAGRLPQAEALYQQILQIEPNHPDALHLSGVVSLQAKDLQRALESISRALSVNPNNAVFHNNLGLVLQDLGRFDAALASFDKAIALKADYAGAYCNRGILLQDLNQLDAALASYNKAIALKADYAEAYHGKAIISLLKGDFDKGWALYEWRWKSAALSNVAGKRIFPQPLWRGNESLAGKTILLYGEQGLGDMLQFCRYATMVANLGARVVLEVQPPLAGLLACVEGVAQIVEKGAALPDFDYHCPLLSLPLAFKTRLDTIPSPAKYLVSDSNKVAQWSARLGEKTRPRIGLVWSGGQGHKNDRNRSLQLSALIQQLPAGFQYVSLQKEVRDSDNPVLQSRPDILDFANDLKDFGDTAALCELMDVVISVDTSVAHLAAALGKPTWIFLPFVPDWRWLLDRTDSPWYSSARLYRQQKAGDWEEVIRRVGSDLAQSLNSGRP